VKAAGKNWGVISKYQNKTKCPYQHALNMKKKKKKLKTVA
jgi:hypothetical protein